MTARAADLLDGVFARERQREIARIVEEDGRARVAELADRFGVSAVTIRKDLLVLEGERRVVRTHQWIERGGARHEPLDVDRRSDAPEGAARALEACA